VALVAVKGSKTGRKGVSRVVAAGRDFFEDSGSTLRSKDKL